MYQDSNITVTLPPPPPSLTQPASTPWTRFDDKRFEQALVLFSDDLPDRWQQIGDYVGKPPSDVKEHYNILVHDVGEIDSGRVELPCYADDEINAWDSGPSSQISFGASGGGGGAVGGKGTKGGDAERKKGTPWTEEEHKLFLIGLSRFGKGDWRSISRNVVISRTPTQVASHAQKYFLRQSAVKKDRKRSSIHDITTVNNSLVGQVDENLIPPSPASAQQPQVLQQMPPASHLPNQGGTLGYQNFGFHM